MNYGEMADDAGVVLSSMRIQRGCACPVEKSFSERQKSKNDDMPWATILRYAITDLYLVHSNIIHHVRDGVTSTPRDKTAGDHRYPRPGRPHPRAARTVIQRRGGVQGIPRRMS
jgi:hypothetical protein